MIDMFTEPTQATVNVTKAYTIEISGYNTEFAITSYGETFLRISKCEDCTKDILYNIILLTNDNFLDNINLNDLIISSKIFQINKPYGNNEQIEYHIDTNKIYLKKFSTINGSLIAEYTDLESNSTSPIFEKFFINKNDLINYTLLDNIHDGKIYSVINKEEPLILSYLDDYITKELVK